MPEQTVEGYTSTYRPVNADFYRAKLIGFEFLDGTGREYMGRPMGDSYKLLWEIPDAGEKEFWDFVGARIGLTKEGLPSPLKATFNALIGREFDPADPKVSGKTPGQILEALIGREVELFLEPITKDGKTRNKATKRRAIKGNAAPKLEKIDIPPQDQTAPVVEDLGF